MNCKVWLLPMMLGGTLSAVYFLPRVGDIADSAVAMELADSSGKWVLQSQPASEAEIKTLSSDTRFSKAICYSARPGEFNVAGKPVPDVIHLSIVLSGSDLNNSIHRPERCMPAQGHNITSSGKQALTLPGGREFETKRLVSIQSLRDARVTDREVYLKYNCLTYYYFVGHDRVTNDHLGRTFIDMKDRLVHGMDQRWAYVSASMWYGKVPWVEKEITETEADAKLRTFLTEFSGNQIKWDQITR
ncbi:MAG TPA: exosortase-associated EpsI family protein [Luteolibacter sp.]